MYSENEFLKSIRSSSKADEIVQNLRRLKTDLQNAEISVADDSDVFNTVEDSVNAVIMLKRTLLQFETLLGFFQKEADKSIPQLKSYFDSLIFNYKTAYDATENFDKDWFSNQMFSEQGKIEIASYLLKCIKVYCKDNTQTLEMISSGDIDILLYIRLPRVSKGI